jgi:hypothetical protein
MTISFFFRGTSQIKVPWKCNRQMSAQLGGITFLSPYISLKTSAIVHFNDLYAIRLRFNECDLYEKNREHPVWEEDFFFVFTITIHTYLYQTLSWTLIANQSRMKSDQRKAFTFSTLRPDLQFHANPLFSARLWYPSDQVHCYIWISGSEPNSSNRDIREPDLFLEATVYPSFWLSGCLGSLATRSRA